MDRPQTIILKAHRSHPDREPLPLPQYPSRPHQAPVEISLGSRQRKGYFYSVFNLSLWNVLRTSHRLNFTSKYFTNIINISQHFSRLISFTTEGNLVQQSAVSTCFKLFIFPSSPVQSSPVCIFQCWDTLGLVATSSEGWGWTEDRHSVASSSQ